MRRFRLITVLAMMLSLPFAGIATIASAFACAPKVTAAVSEHDCCPGAAGQQAGTKHDAGNNSDCGHCNAATCKTSQPCQALLLPEFGADPARQLIAATLDSPVPAFQPDTPLRPPSV